MRRRALISRRSIRPAELGIVGVATAASGNVDEVLTLTGRLIIDPPSCRVAAVRAISGPVVAVLKEVASWYAGGQGPRPRREQREA